jgi:hypothetical protein
MRRVTIELRLEELSKFEHNPLLETIKSLEILQFLKDGPSEFAAIFRIEFGDERLTVKDFIDDDILELQELDHEKGGAYIYFMKTKPVASPNLGFNPLAIGGYLSLPFEIWDGKARISYLGDGKQIEGFLEGVERSGIRYRVANITDAKFPQDSPLSRLTEKQRKVIVAAYRLGYYDEPRRISSMELARRMRIGASTLINHRRRAERHLLGELIGG